jgi:hypothetical protein
MISPGDLVMLKHLNQIAIMVAKVGSEYFLMMEKDIVIWCRRRDFRKLTEKELLYYGS